MSLRLDLEGAEEGRGTLVEEPLIRFELDVSGAEGGEHVGVLRVDVLDGGRDVLPEGWPQVRIVTGGGPTVKEVHVGRQRSTPLLAEQRFELRCLEI